MARPYKFNDIVADEIVRRLIEGESMRSICMGDDMPHRSTVIRWMADDEGFATKCARARELQADALFDEIQEVADKGNPDDVQRAKLRVSTMQWRAAKLAPKKYGEKVAVVGGGPDDEPIKIDEGAAAARLAAIMAAAAARRDAVDDEG